MEGLRQYVISVTTAAIVCGMLTAMLKKGAMQSLVKLLCARELRVRVISGLMHLWHVAGGENRPYPKDLAQSRNVIHFSLPVLLGTIAAMALELLV